MQKISIWHDVKIKNYSKCPALRLLRHRLVLLPWTGLSSQHRRCYTWILLYIIFVLSATGMGSDVASRQRHMIPQARLKHTEGWGGGGVLLEHVPLFRGIVFYRTGSESWAPVSQIRFQICLISDLRSVSDQISNLISDQISDQSKICLRTVSDLGFRKASTSFTNPFHPDCQTDFFHFV